KKKKRSKKRKEEKALTPLRRKSRRTEHKTTPRERVVYREKPVSPTIGTPTKRQWQDVHRKKREEEEKSKKEREQKRKSDKKETIKRAGRNVPDQTTGPYYQQLVYKSFVTNGLNVAHYNYDQREVQKNKAGKNLRLLTSIGPVPLPP
ncbi:hypothetical protein PENTCL1PPCAC_10811, partial [Pristionchus entomophagus]